MAHVNSHDTKIDVKPDGHARRITFTHAAMPDGRVVLESPWIRARAHMILRGSPGEVVTGWKFGCIQLKFVSTDWAYYRGPTNADGSVFVALDRKPARQQQLCRDTDPGSSMFYETEAVGPPVAAGRRTLVLGPTTLPASGQLAVQVDYADRPRRTHPLSWRNTNFAPSKVNYLHEVQLEAAFATIFGANDPAGRFHPLKHFYWNVQGQCRFRRGPSGAFVITDHPLVRLHVQGHVQDGSPHDGRFAGHTTDTGLPVCNTVIDAARASPVVKYSSVWSNFDVKHPVR
jgi:hypothetical protein